MSARIDAELAAENAELAVIAGEAFAQHMRIHARFAPVSAATFEALGAQARRRSFELLRAQQELMTFSLR